MTLKRIYKRWVNERSRIAIRYTLYIIQAAFLRGSRYACCCCGKSSRRFLSHGEVEVRQNVKCPHCLSLERTRIMCMYLREVVFKEIPQPIRVLDFAPVKGLTTFFRNAPQVGEYVDADLNPHRATHQVDITQIPYPDNSFDLVICSHILYCVPQDRKGMQEISRVLRPGGHALLVEEIVGDNTTEHGHLPARERRKLYGDPSSCRIYGRDIEQILASYGLVAHTVDYAKQLSAEFLQKQCLTHPINSEIIDCTKP